MPVKKSGRTTKEQKPRVNVADLEPNPPDAKPDEKDQVRGGSLNTYISKSIGEKQGSGGGGSRGGLTGG